MSIFENKITIFRKQNKAAWLAAKEALKSAGIRGIRAGQYDVDPPVCGCGAKLDPRNLGTRGAIDRSMYYIKVPAAEMARTQKALETIRPEKQSKQS